MGSRAGLRLEGIPALNLWDMVTEVLEALSGRNSMRNTTSPKDETSHDGQEVNRQY